jgi:hypothetical protein
MSPYCRACGSENLRLSRFRVDDVAPLLRFHYPVRCRNCNHRSFFALPSVLIVGIASRVRRRHAISGRKPA